MSSVASVLRRMNRARILVVLRMAMALGLVSCGDDPVTNNQTPCYAGGCTTRDLPLVDGPDAPSLIDMKLECQPQSVVVLATATDPQGSANLQDVMQTIGVYTDRSCSGTPLTVQDDFVGVDVEESFGDAFRRADNPALYDQICGCTQWPVLVDMVDADGHTTTGRVVAAVIH